MCVTHTQTHTIKHLGLILSVCFFQFSVCLFLSRSLSESGHCSVQPMCATTQFTSQHEKFSARTHTQTHRHTHSCLSVCHYGWQVGSGRTLHGRFQSNHCQLQPKKTQFNTVQTLRVCLSWHSMWMTIWHFGLPSRRHLTSDPGHRCVVTSQEAGGGPPQRLLLRIAATRFSHLLFTFPPSISISLCYCSQLT